MGKRFLEEEGSKLLSAPSEEENGVVGDEETEAPLSATEDAPAVGLPLLEEEEVGGVPTDSGEGRAKRERCCCCCCCCCCCSFTLLGSTVSGGGSTAKGSSSSPAGVPVGASEPKSGSSGDVVSREESKLEGGALEGFSGVEEAGPRRWRPSGGESAEWWWRWSPDAPEEESPVLGCCSSSPPQILFISSSMCMNSSSVVPEDEDSVGSPTRPGGRNEPPPQGDPPVEDRPPSCSSRPSEGEGAGEGEGAISHDHGHKKNARLQHSFSKLSKMPPPPASLPR